MCIQNRNWCLWRLHNTKQSPEAVHRHIQNCHCQCSSPFWVPMDGNQILDNTFISHIMLYLQVEMRQQQSSLQPVCNRKQSNKQNKTQQYFVFVVVFSLAEVRKRIVLFAVRVTASIILFLLASSFFFQPHSILSPASVFLDKEVLLVLPASCPQLLLSSVFRNQLQFHSPSCN